MLGIGGSIAYYLYKMVLQVDETVTSTKEQVEHTLSSLHDRFLPWEHRIDKAKDWMKRTKERWNNIIHRQKEQHSKDVQQDSKLHDGSDEKVPGNEIDNKTTTDFNRSIPLKSNADQVPKHHHHHVQTLKEKIQHHFEVSHSHTDGTRVDIKERNFEASSKGNDSCNDHHRDRDDKAA